MWHRNALLACAATRLKGLELRARSAAAAGTSCASRFSSKARGVIGISPEDLLSTREIVFDSCALVPCVAFAGKLPVLG
jgi:hypothetical protein